MEAGVFRLVDDAHSASAKLFHDPVVRNGLADHAVKILRLELGQVNEYGIVDDDC